MTAGIGIHLQDGPLPPAPPIAADGAGALLAFEGVVRPTEQGRPLAALVYEAYEPMTTRELTRLAQRTADEFGLLAITVEHSIGRVAVGEVSFRLRTASRHRAEGLRACGAFIDEMKRSVPLWKVPEHR